MKGPRARHTKPVRIDAANRFAKRKHSVHQVEIKFQNFTRTRIRAVMAVMKERNESQLLLQGQDAVYHPGFVPLVKQNHIRSAELALQKLSEIGIGRPV